jgi:hypothetical protein
MRYFVNVSNSTALYEAVAKILKSKGLTTEHCFYGVWCVRFDEKEFWPSSMLRESLEHGGDKEVALADLPAFSFAPKSFHLQCGAVATRNTAGGLTFEYLHKDEDTRLNKEETEQIFSEFSVSAQNKETQTLIVELLKCKGFKLAENAPESVHACYINIMPATQAFQTAILDWGHEVSLESFARGFWDVGNHKFELAPKIVRVSGGLASVVFSELDALEKFWEVSK